MSKVPSHVGSEKESLFASGLRSSCESCWMRAWATGIDQMSPMTHICKLAPIR